MNRCWIIAAAALLALTAGAGPVQAHYLPEHVALVEGWCARFLCRKAEKADIHHWCSQLAWHKAPIAVMTGIVATDEYYKRHGGNPADFVCGLYADFLQRSPSPQDLNYWTHRLQVRHNHRYRFIQEFVEVTAFENYRPLPHMPMLAPVVPPPWPGPQPRH